MTAPFWASLLLVGFGALAVLFQTQPRHRAFAIVAFVAAAGFAASRLLPLAAASALFGLWLWQGMPTSPGQPRGQGRAPPRGPSEVSSAGLRMTLDRETGEMEGEVLSGPHAGSRLADLPPDALRALAEGFEAAGDEESLSLLLAWLDRTGRRDEAAPSSAGPMTEAEAYRVLGLEPGASVSEVREAHRRLMRRVHPDLGGSGALAALLNAAKDVLDPG